MQHKSLPKCKYGISPLFQLSDKKTRTVLKPFRTISFSHFQTPIQNNTKNEKMYTLPHEDYILITGFETNIVPGVIEH